MEKFIIANYVGLVVAQKTAETALETASGKARDGHVSFYHHLTVKPLDLAAIREAALSALQSFAGDNWPCEAGKGFVGYQKAAKSGCNAAIAYNRFAAWSVTNVNADGTIMTAEQKETNKKAAQEKKENEAKTAQDTAIQSAIDEATKGMVDASLLVPFTVENCIDFLISAGFAQTTDKKGKVTLKQV